MKKKYVVRVNQDGIMLDVKSDADIYSFKEMKEIYNKTKECIKHGNITLLSIENNLETVIYSKTIELQKDKIDQVVDSLIENLDWLIAYSENASEVMSAIDISRDAYLKKIELYPDNFDFTEENKKENIFDTLQEILSLRRKIKYSKLLVDTIASRIDLKSIKETLIHSRAITKKKPCVNVSSDAFDILEKESIQDIFEIDSINRIKQIKKSNDKLILLNNSITPMKKVDFNSNLETITLSKNESISNLDKAINNNNINNTNNTLSNTTNSKKTVLYKGRSYKKLKNCKIAYKKELIHNFKEVTSELKRTYNYIDKVEDKVYGYIYKKKYNNMALVEVVSNFSELTILKKNKEWDKTEIVDGRLYCLANGILT